MQKSTILFTSLVLVAVLIAGWSVAIIPASAAPEGSGSVQFVANGEDFVRQGFTTKDGWDVGFEHVYVTLSGITAYQSDPPYDADSGNEAVSGISVALPGTHTVDLAAGGEEAEPVVVGVVADAPAGFYNAVAFQMTPAVDGPAAGYSLVVQGTAEKDGEAVDFVLKIDDVYAFTCGEYIGDMRKGILQEGGTSDLEMTFHFDHLFGDAETPPDDGLNTGALGFEPLVAFAQDGVVDLDMDGLKTGLSAGDYQKLLDILPTLGHVGEGHCHCRTSFPGLMLSANGEDFIRQGFTTKDGWDVGFEHVYVTLSGITAYQSDPPYDTDAGSDAVSGVSVALPGTHTVDLAACGEEAEPVVVGVVADAPAGFYNAVAFQMTPAVDGPAAGYSLVVQGTAEKDGEIVDFVLKIDDMFAFTCGEYIGDMRKGILQEGGTADLEMTFHFDHLFGDAETPPDDGLNTGALGFEPLVALAQDGVVDLDMDGLKTGLSAGDYQKLLDMLPTLGHVGEGHCHCEMDLAKAG